LNRNVGEPQSWSGCLREEVNLVFAGTRFLDFPSRYPTLYTDYLLYVASVIVLSLSLTDGHSLSGSQHSRAVPENTFLKTVAVR
jgi:hypothetical protein